MKIGKVIDFDGNYGEIITNENFEKYFFLIKEPLAATTLTFPPNLLSVREQNYEISLIM